MPAMTKEPSTVARLDHLVVVRFDEQQALAMRAAAAQGSVTVSDLVRRAVQRELSAPREA